MWRPHLDDLPDPLVPEGYHLRTYRPGDERAWGEIMESEGGIGREWTVEKVRERLVSQPQFEAPGLFFATSDTESGRPVASACAWRGGVGGEEAADRRAGQREEAGDTGTVHMVCAMPSHRGRGLGRLVTLAVLHYMRRRGFASADLATDDFRLAAIKSYLGLGFVPLYRTDAERMDDHEARWSAIFATIISGNHGNRATRGGA